jgi:ATP-dependent Lon protease
MPNTQNSSISAGDLLTEIKELEKNVANAKIPEGLKEKCIRMLRRLNRMAKHGGYGGYAGEYEKIVHYFDWVLNLPWTTTSEDMLDLVKAKEVLDKNHYGLNDLKERMMEFLSVLKLTRDRTKISRSPILCLVGLVGTGKTTFGYSLAEALGRKFARIPFGGMGSALDLRGQSRLHPDNEPGQVVKALRRTQTKNPVIMLDEIDRVSEQGRADIMGVLVELLDPEQNEHFIDHYIDYPFDLSDVLFIATCNNTTNVSTAVLDRLEILQMPSYSDEEKIMIAKNYVLPKVIEECGLKPENITIQENLWPQIVRPLGFDGGIRTLERTIEGACRKIAKKIVMKEGQHFHLNQKNVKEFLPSW